MQGYQGTDLIATIDLGTPENVQQISLGALQDIKSWIWYPTTVNFYLSADGKTFKKVGAVENDFPDNQYGAFTKQFTLDLETPSNAKYIKIEATNYGKCPEWHLGAGGSAWLFVDEISIVSEELK